MRITNLVNKLNDGESLSNDQLHLLMYDLHKIEQALLGAGDLYKATRVMTSHDLGTVKSICKARGMNDDPERLSCPHCYGALTIPENVRRNMESYQKSALIASPCCGKPVRAFLEIKTGAVDAHTNQTEDDWGTPFKN